MAEDQPENGSSDAHEPVSLQHYQMERNIGEQSLIREDVQASPLAELLRSGVFRKRRRRKPLPDNVTLLNQKRREKE